MSTEAQMVRVQMVLEALASEQTLHTFIGLLTGLPLEDVVSALEEINEAVTRG